MESEAFDPCRVIIAITVTSELKPDAGELRTFILHDAIDPLYFVRVAAPPKPCARR